MAHGKILVLGATGPSGIVLLRELLHRGHTTIAYVRSPGKIPAELARNALLEVVEGQMDDLEKLDAVVTQSSVVLSILGPKMGVTPDPALYRAYYSALFASMKRHGVKRILAMSTPSAAEPTDNFSLILSLSILLLRLVLNSAWRTVREIANVFREEGQGLDWTVYRIPVLTGGDTAESWARERDSGEAYTGPVGGRGWKMSLPRAVLASWLVDSAEGKHDGWIGKMPALSLRG